MATNPPELKLLVVDWDFFFPNPAHTADPTEEAMLYLWDHREAPAYLGPLVWSGRAAAFLRNGMELPRARDYEGFWDRFKFNEDGVPVMYGDSNLHAGRILPSTFQMDEDYDLEHDRWHTVSLWDAHHDSGYKSTGSYEKWQATGMVSCEDWMLVHHGHGSRLQVTYPAWMGGLSVEREPLVPVERRLDDGSDPDDWYDAVYICRSGAWVPPWCDDQFTEFLDAAPNAWPVLLDPEEWVHPRPDGVTEAHQHAEAGALFDGLSAGGGISRELVEELRRQREGRAQAS